MLEAVTRRLLDIEVMEGDDLRRVMGLLPEAAGAPDDSTVPLPPTDGLQ
jgi:hypothetical protein